MVLPLWSKSILALIRVIKIFILLSIFPIYAENAKEATLDQEPQLRVIALFKNAAMVDYAGKQKLYRAGQNVTKGIKLIKADTRSATFRINQEILELDLSTRYDGSLLTSKDKKQVNNEPAENVQAESLGNAKTARIVRNLQGHYMTGGFINGISVSFLVDTGATTIAMGERHARLIGLDYKLKGIKSIASTASGNVTVWNITLNKVRVGGIVLNNVRAGVIKGIGPREILLGMSFLNRIKMNYDGPLLTFSKIY